MIASLSSPLPDCLALVTAWLAIGIAGLARPRSVRYAGRTLFVVGALVALALAATAVWSLIGGATQSMVLPIGLPDLPFHLRLDPLSSAFLLLLGAAAAGVSLFSAGYFRDSDGMAPGLLCLQYHVFLASMGLVLLANDAYAYMVGWELMALSSYFLVTTQHRIAEIRAAGFIYLLMAHVGALAILLAFGILQGGSWQFTFDAMRAAHLSPAWAAGAFLLALAGFGAKAGLVPLHVWLPEAHPAAPSPVSALLSGVMLKTAVYGMLRVAFDLLGHPVWWWGLVPLAAGLLTALYGVVFAAVQTDMKRLLAYSSIENVGLLFTGLGLAIVFYGTSMPALAALALLATLYHSLNHAAMKSLLFLGTGSVLHATGQRNLGRLGGLIHRMPWVAGLTLVGTLALAGLPPLNGFVSEWLLLQSFLFADQIPRAFVDLLIPLGAAVVALCAALAGYVMVKFYGVIFLGQPRESSLAHAHDCSLLERVGLGWLAALCLALGLAPAQVVSALTPVTRQLTGSATAQGASWWLLAPVPARAVSYAPLLFLLAGAAVVALTVLLVRLFYHRRVRHARPWDCGFGEVSPRMQDTAEGFGQPIRNIFQSFFAIERELPTPFDAAPRYRIAIHDRIWLGIYQPIAGWVRRLADVVAGLQQGRIAAYLLYSFATLVLLLAVVLAT
ncbi:MAG: hydrogenase 4 subunit B [Gammaproteobacteria bacterium]|nr:hydrogenase 4 subunit B [Gammaproteobacteria bacterium]MDE2262971.1 hydrogenase 4 subunit B [Gammaproteobacteria bacterium]